MNAEKFSEAMNELDDKYVIEASCWQQTKKRNNWVKWGAVAACFVLVISVAVPYLAGGGAGGRPIAPYIQEDVTRAKISHTSMGQTTAWNVQGAELDALRTWANGLRYEMADFESGNTPADIDGSEVYKVRLTQGDYPGFSYIITKEEGDYLLIEGYWYTVTNPSAPPVAAPD